ncbi:4-coumarate--CoA ligase 1 isoform X2 [Agrilus planipennis]|uniref:4-coumarate--CoA ligase 1 isoform X2 n=1 Tax=Agrilus planipennis TaxID=224129 RepID=A0A1W4WUS0_AGRPL|nr:4-coumarate--CoA ligase 1 isoform X2 [Agrilus planipennis]
MDTDSDLIIRGPKDNSTIPTESLGKLLLDVIKSSNKDKAIFINGLTGECMTNGDLMEKSIKLCKFLESGMNLKKGDVMTIVSDNNLWYPVIFLAGFATGIVVNVINPVYTIGELHRLLNLADPKLIFCSKEALKSIKQVSKSVESVQKVIVLTESSYDQIPSIGEVLEQTKVDVNNFKPIDIDVENDTAIILCSSGSTGFPKGVEITHKNIRGSIIYMYDPVYAEISSDVTSLILLPMYHIVGTLGTILAIYSNCLTVVLNAFKPQLFLETIEKYKIRFLSLVPTVLQFIAKGDLVPQYNLDSLNYIYSSGYKLDKEIEDGLKKRLKNLKRVCQIYGATELAGGCTMQLLSRSDIGGCGVLVHGYSAKVCHLKTGEALKRGETGEIRVKGPGIMKGYIKNEAETKASFDNEGFWKTGDIGYFDEHGALHIVDRLKELIKYKGFQVAPSELESILNSHPSVVEAAVVGITDDRVGELPTAFVVKDENCSVTEKDISDFVADRVSIQKRLHGGVKFVKELPKSQNGKVLRKTLREMAK